MTRGLLFLLVAACGRPSTGPAPVRIAPLESSKSTGACAGLDYCACTARAECSPRFGEGCVCGCDFRCAAEDPACMCACGGAKFLACEARATP